MPHETHNRSNNVEVVGSCGCACGGYSPCRGGPLRALCHRQDSPCNGKQWRRPAGWDYRHLKNPSVLTGGLLPLILRSTTIFIFQNYKPHPTYDPHLPNQCTKFKNKFYFPSFFLESRSRTVLFYS